MKRKFHVRCGAGEKSEITSKTYLSQYLYDIRNQWFPIKQRGKGYGFAITPKINQTNENKEIKNMTVPPEKEIRQNKLQRAKTFKLTFGKYSGKTLGDIYNSDKKYFRYIIDQSQDQALVNACRYLESHLLN